MISKTQSRLILMLKYPQAGEVKTRLIPALGGRRACELYRALVRHTLNEVERFTAQEQVSVEARVADVPVDGAVSQWLEGVHFRLQGDGSLGQRMERAVQDAFADGAPSVVVIGADCPQLTRERLRAAFRALESKDVVLGPATDGGYYLIGMRRFLPELFRGIHWSSALVLEQTLTALRQARIEGQLLDTLHDLDRPEDLPCWAQTHSAKATGKGKISVIIPALNEASHLKQTLEAAQRGHPHELIVVDGGSTDETMEVARSLDSIVVSGPGCRAQQMNLGAAIATGEHLLFLHADTLLPSDYSPQVSSLLNEPGVVGGAFTFAVACDFAGRRLIERATNWRARRRQFPYGDQGLFLRLEMFNQLGGFREMAIMEDYEFVRRLRRLGRIGIAPTPAITSGRRWQRLGLLRTTLINRMTILAYHLGVPPSRLATWYRGRTSRQKIYDVTTGAEPRPTASKCSQLRLSPYQTETKFPE